MHFPDGATRKDGPSAGIAITTTLLSLAIDKAIPKDIGMTGEITLNGKVLPIGGVEVKTLAAKREGLKRLVFPESNAKDIEKLPDSVKKGLEFTLAKDYSEVAEFVFGDSL